MRIIKKYNNRKLYDTTDSQYVTLIEIFKLSLENELKVIDNRTKVDLTQAVMLKALYELEKFYGINDKLFNDRVEHYSALIKEDS